MDIVLFVLDYHTSRVTLYREDGKVATVALELPPQAVVGFSQVTVSPLTRAVILRTDSGDEIVAELPGGDDRERLAGRLSVYLDQKSLEHVGQSAQRPRSCPQPR